MGIHQETHPEPVDGCFGCKIASVSVAASAMPSRKGGAQAAAVNAKEKEWHRDMDAYRAIRRSGLQPAQIDGAHKLEGASDKMEVEMGHLFPTKEVRAKVREGMVRAAEMQADAS